MFLILLIVLLVSLFLLVPAQTLYNTYTHTITEEMQNHAHSIAYTTALLIAMDSDSYKNLVRIAQQDPTAMDQHYAEKMQGLLSRLQQETGVDFLYIEYDIEGASPIILLNGDVPNATACQIKTGLEAERVCAHCPIIGIQDGSFLGMVTAGFLHETLDKQLQNMFCLILLMFFLINVLASLTIFILLRLRNTSLQIEYLTQLSSKQYFEKQLGKIVESARKSKNPFSLLLIDIDGFKSINDTYGHLEGDRVLQSVASTIRAQTAGPDICARIGGDEFSVILKKTSLQQALTTAQAVQNAIQDSSIEGNADMTITVSIGVAQWEEGTSADELVEQADRALYKAKLRGKNKVVH